jgi:Ice-binding-like
MKSSGDVGVSPGTAVTGFSPGTMLAGSIHSGDPVAAQAQAATSAAYDAAAALAPTGFVTDLGGMTLTPGVYAASAASIGVTGDVTLDARGDPNAVFVFQAGSTVITSANSHVLLINGAQACNVWWQVGSSATIGVGSAFAGNIMALASITMTTGASLNGRAIARNGAVTLDTNAITIPTC